jgi:MerR family copper efflux transcriptional regulator
MMHESAPLHERAASGPAGHRPYRTPAAMNAQRFNIGQAAARSGVTAKMIRYYESLGLLPSVPRTEAGYRLYGDNEVHTLRFIGRGRNLGFGMDEIAELLKLWQNRRRASADVKRIALAHVANLERRMDQMMSMKRTLEALAASCHGDERAACPILDELAE